MPRFSFLFTAVALFAATFSILVGQDANQVCAHAVDLHRARNLDDAVTEYRKCIELAPSLVQMRSNLGAALAQLGRYQEAIAEYKTAIEKGADDVRLRQNLALAYYKSGAIADAANEFEKLHAADASNLQVTMLLADSRLQLGEPKKALELLQILEPNAGDNRTFQYLYGTALIRGGEVQKGQTIIDRILAEKDSAEARMLLGNAAFVSGDLPRAVQEFGKAAELNPSLPTVHSWYGQSLLMTGDADAAAAEFKRELASSPNDYESNLKLGQIRAVRGDAAAAIECFQRALLARPGSLEARTELASAFLKVGKLIESKAEFQQVLKQAPAFTPAHSGMAEVYSKLNMPADAARERGLAGKLQADDDTGLLAVGSAAPAFTLRRAGSTATLSLADLRKSKPLVLVFGSYTCPKFRFDSAALNDLYNRYHDRAEFLLVYVQEAHSDAEWQSTINEREKVALAPAKNYEQKDQYAITCSRKLPVKYPAVVDGLERAVEKAYGAWPSAVYVINPNGRIAFRSRLGEQEFSAPAMESALRSLGVSVTSAKH
jgi:tetratricopeptide (TPR) repeat protein